MIFSKRIAGKKQKDKAAIIMKTHQCLILLYKIFRVLANKNM